ncbi:glutamate racemase [Gilvimarinus chinensis]|uniref:glutamate racemase n=1 Tax=Gilvimarinus chinensis TaxID=396005 RepID=UPI0003789676|nr:glutamate racemase [Gilvimarinus chinensis]
MTKPYRTPHILIFDSGVGGLSVYQHIRLHIPQAQLSYLSDNGGFPYGDKEERFLISRCAGVIEQYLQQSSNKPDVIVIACNTASTLALPHLRQRLTQPVVGVVPAIKPAANASNNKYMGVLATPGTINRDYTRHLIQSFASSCHVVTSGSTQLVHLAEAKLRGETVPELLLASCLKKFVSVSPANPYPAALDCLVLACTHFPLLKEEIARVLGPQVMLMDSGDAIARRVAYWIHELGFILSNNAQPHKSNAFFTLQDDKLNELKPGLEQFGIESYSVLTLSAEVPKPAPLFANHLIP